MFMHVLNQMETSVVNGVSKQESRFRVSRFVVDVHAQHWVTFSLVQTKKCCILSFSQMKKLVFIQTNLRVLQSVETNDAIQGSNLDDIDNTKVPDLGQLPK
jgi:replication initiation and membrane attachment protein DnaB